LFFLQSFCCVAEKAKSKPQLLHLHRVGFNNFFSYLRGTYEVYCTFAIGHFALGYLIGKGSSKLAKVKVNLPLLLVASVLSDVDLLLGFIMHRGPTHSLVTITVLMIPFFVVYRKQAIPYYAALLSHILIGDFFTGGVQLFWPLSQSWFGALNIDINSLTNAISELGLFFVTLPIMYKLGDLQTFLKPHNKNWALIVPLGAALGPLLGVGRGQENYLPTILMAPSLFYIGLFAYSMFVELRAEHNQDADKLQPSNTSQCVFPSFATPDGYCSYVSSVLDGLNKSGTKIGAGIGALDPISYHSLTRIKKI
jgi:membrane-bound metal-dependent hydrolase YbcI (DUF457 family)